ncbi:MAG: glycosyltransferase [Bacteroidia bacterium]|nr:glycosyltransferase [Bacteroidia bacterium]
MELSVIIVSYNVRYFLEQALRSVRKASENIDCEVFVVDNNSTDGSCSMVTREFPEIKLVMNPVNKGFSAANNQAFKMASGRYILLLNPDTLVEENTFRSCISFMDSHPDAGASGVRMINGKGKLLPESKRALPTPRTAFFKMSGLSYLFPKSRFFNRYYLGHLDSLETTKADIISGAFMFLRREAVEKTGLLDEAFFMYGEDIDYSYRLQKAGYNNYYYPEIKIIHYKGESTKKENLNTVVNFYRAMVIFVKKHFSNGSMKGFVHFIQAAILFSAGLSFLRKSFKRALLPIFDIAAVFLAYRFATVIWALHKFGEGYRYPGLFTDLIIPGYTLVIILSIALFSGYRIPSRILNPLKGIFSGSLIILIIYALLPLNLRFSRAIIIIGGLLSVLSVPFYRLLLSFLRPDIAENPLSIIRKTVIVADQQGYSRVLDLIESTKARNIIAGRVSVLKDDLAEEVLGNLTQLSEVLRVNRIKEVIFTTRNLSASQIINSMHEISNHNITIRIASADEKYLLGSRYISPKEDLTPFIKSSFRKGD